MEPFRLIGRSSPLKRSAAEIWREDTKKRSEREIEREIERRSGRRKDGNPREFQNREAPLAVRPTFYLSRFLLFTIR